MAKDIKASDITAGLQKMGMALKRHAGIIFVVIVLAALVYSISAVNIVLNTPSDQAYRDEKESEVTNTQFDRATIQKIEALGDRQSIAPPTLPTGRINPFVE